MWGFVVVCDFHNFIPLKYLQNVNSDFCLFFSGQMGWTSQHFVKFFGQDNIWSSFLLSLRSVSLLGPLWIQCTYLCRMFLYEVKCCKHCILRESYHGLFELLVCSCNVVIVKLYFRVDSPPSRTSVPELWWCSVTVKAVSSGCMWVVLNAFGNVKSLNCSKSMRDVSISVLMCAICIWKCGWWHIEGKLTIFKYRSVKLKLD